MAAESGDHLPSYEFQKCVERYRGDAHQRGFSCRRVAPISAPFSSCAEGAPGPSQLGTGETTNPNRAALEFCGPGRITAYSAVAFQ
jgi:hypothetical protein